ncbi:hypothetical protein MBLNU230_g1651t1 [Neophaeotheca triangularis]
MADSDLTKLCSICYEQPPKYKCPRCMTATCSLPCYKKHQQRAVCNGKRDPSKYKKKSELATPSGIDHDYNYLKGLERTIDRASEDVNPDQGDVMKAVARGRQKGSMLDVYLRENDITVEHPPKGMARDLQNKTRLTKSKRVAWTIEWVDSSGKSEISDNFTDDVPIGELFSRRLAEKRNAVKRELDGHGLHSQSQARKEAKRLEGLDLEAESGRGSKIRKTSHVANPNPSPGSHDHATQWNAPRMTKAPATSGTDPASGSEMSSGICDDRVAVLDATKTATPGSPHKGGNDSETEPGIEPSSALKQKAAEDRDTNIYLLRPGTAASVRVLAPVKKSLSLTQLLRGRIVRGFPILYVLPNQPDSLPEGFLLEKEYLKSRKEEDKELRKLIEEVPDAGDEMEEGEVEVPDGNSILDMLRRDVS